MHGVIVVRDEENHDWYELTDSDGDPVTLHIPTPVPSEVIVYLYRRFGEMHGFPITALRATLKPS
jgi:hypothetical protein